MKENREEIQYRPYRSEDFAALAALINKTWQYDAYVSEKTAHLMAIVDLQESLDSETYTQVAVQSGRVVGFLLGRIEREKETFENSPVYTKNLRKIGLRPDGLLVYGFWREMSAANRWLLRKSPSGGEEYEAELTFFAVDETCRGRGVGKHLITRFFDYLKEHHVSKGYLYTDSFCNYGFYDHLGLIRRAEKTWTFPFSGGKQIRFMLYEYHPEEETDLL